MTTAQLEELKSHPREAVMKYGQMLLEGKIDREKYDWIIRQISTPTATETTGEAHAGDQGSSEPEGANETIGDVLPSSTASGGGGGPGQIAEGRTHHPDKIAGNSQKERILRLLLDGQWHDTVEIMNRCYRVDDQKAGNCRIPSRIDDLRNDGYDIPKAERVRKGVWRYRLIKKVSPFYGG